MLILILNDKINQLKTMLEQQKEASKSIYCGSEYDVGKYTVQRLMYRKCEITLEKENQTAAFWKQSLKTKTQSLSLKTYGLVTMTLSKKSAEELIQTKMERVMLRITLTQRIRNKTIVQTTQTRRKK